MRSNLIHTRTQNLFPPFVLSSNFSTSKHKEKKVMTSSGLDVIKPDYAWDNSSFLSNNYLDNITTTLDVDRYQIANDTGVITIAGDPEDTTWTQCKEWTPAQHTLFQTAHFFFAAAFLVPGSFKQSVLLVRGLLTIGYIFLMAWGSVDVCAPDILLWNFMLVLLNLIHTAVLTWKFLPPTLSLELMELYLKVFKPFRVDKKQFKELVREGKVMTLDQGDIYAVEDVSPADEKLSILLRGKLRVTCDDTHLHFVNVHQFVDSPEWEANHEQSDNVFQVTIIAEEDSVYFCWPRMKLERVLRHKPRLKVIFDSIIGKDITQKLYALNEHLSGISAERNRERQNKIWARNNIRSMSMDAVNTGTTGLVRSHAFQERQRKHSIHSLESPYFGRSQNQTWIPLVAKQFPASSPFTNQISSDLPTSEVHTATPKPQRKNLTSEVKFEKGLK